MALKSLKYKVGPLLYDAQIYDGMNTDMSDLKFYTKWLSQRNNSKILELCCGTGRLTIPLAKAKLNITGVDITESMLLEARKKAKEAELDIEFIIGDMRSFQLDKKFDVIFIPFNSIHHLYSNSDLFNTLESVKHNLKENGIFMFDCFNPNMQFISENGTHLREISNYRTKDGREVRIKEIMTYESDSQINRIDWHYDINGKFDSVQNLDMRMYFPQELDAYLKWSGFRISHKFGSFQEEKFTKNSDKQIFICQLKYP